MILTLSTNKDLALLWNLNRPNSIGNLAFLILPRLDWLRQTTPATLHILMERTPLLVCPPQGNSEKFHKRIILPRYQPIQHPRTADCVSVSHSSTMDHHQVLLGQSYIHSAACPCGSLKCTNHVMLE